MNALPDSVQEVIEGMMQGVSLERLSTAREKLSGLYKQKIQGLPELKTKDDHLAYLAFRLPATYAALLDIFGRLKERLPDNSIQSLLDFGAGPGTALLAAQTTFDSILTATLIERDSFFIEMGKKLTASLAPFNVNWSQQEFKNLNIEGQFDLSVISYALCELETSLVDSLLDYAFEKTKKALVLVEPGTPRGYETIIYARTRLLQKGGTILAPCPHNKACPIPEGDWCHFSTRLPRSRLHRTIKGAELGYEDEKFSYIVIAKEPQEAQRVDRIIRRPFRGSGFMKFELCTHEGTLQQKTISRKNKELYPLAKKADWGDVLKIPASEI